MAEKVLLVGVGIGGNGVGGEGVAKVVSIVVSKGSNECWRWWWRGCCWRVLALVVMVLAERVWAMAKVASKGSNYRGKDPPCM